MTPLVDWREEPIGRHHDRAGFDCGEPKLNEYLLRYARQNHESGGAKTFIAADPAKPATVLGFYSLAPTSIEYAKVPATIARNLGRYDIGGFRLARLAIAQNLQGQGLGGELLLAAGRRVIAVAAEVGGVALVIDAKDDRAAGWYRRFGALQLVDENELKLILPLATIAAALA